MRFIVREHIWSDHPKNAEISRNLNYNLMFFKDY